MQRIFGGLVLMCALVAPCPSKAQAPFMVPMPLSVETKPDLFEELNKRLGTGNSLTTPTVPRESTGKPPSLTLFSTPLSGEGKSKSPTLDVLRGRTN